jgi:hypothetical protein
LAAAAERDARLSHKSNVFVRSSCLSGCSSADNGDCWACFDGHATSTHPNITACVKRSGV